MGRMTVCPGQPLFGGDWLLASPCHTQRFRRFSESSEPLDAPGSQGERDERDPAEEEVDPDERPERPDRRARKLAPDHRSGEYAKDSRDGHPAGTLGWPNVQTEPDANSPLDQQEGREKDGEGENATHRVEHNHAAGREIEKRAQEMEPETLSRATLDGLHDLIFQLNHPAQIS